MSAPVAAKAAGFGPIDPKKYGKVAVLMGGVSTERDVSLDSGEAVRRALAEEGVDAFGFDTGKRPLVELEALKPDLCFIALHGGAGENGEVQAALEMLGLPYTGCGPKAAQIAMDKYLTKLVWKDRGLPAPDFAVLGPKSDFAQIERGLGLPLFVKPACQGSSVGVVKCDRPGEAKSAWERLAREFPEDRILAERAISGCLEYTCALLDGVELPSIKIEYSSEFFDYDAKYNAPDTLYRCPSGLGADEERELQALAREAFAAVGGESWGRVDFLRDAQGKFWLLEINASPGMTLHSLAPRSASVAGLSMGALCAAVLDTAAAKRPRMGLGFGSGSASGFSSGSGRPGV